MKGLYPSSLFSAISLLLLLSILAGCGPKPGGQSRNESGKPQTSQLLAAPQNSQEITNILAIARDEGDVERAIAALQTLEQNAPSPLKEEAAFRRLELLLENQYPSALNQANTLLSQYPQHALTPYAHFWLTQWWQAQNNNGSFELSANQDYSDYIINELSLTLNHPRLTQELAQQALNLGRNEIINASKQVALHWYLAASHIDQEHQGDWLRAAASDLTWQEILQLHQQGSISPQRDEALYLQFARLQLISGRMHDLQALANLLTTDFPNLLLTEKITAWASGELKDIYIGVMLPLQGPYARYGKQALNGIRMAMNERQGNNIHLYIEDTSAGETAVIAAYQSLVQRNVNWIIGPLLSKHTEALLPYLEDKLPVISLSKENSLAEASSNLFIHNIAKNTQAAFMARYAYAQGLRRMAVIHGLKASEVSEAESFSRTFERLGGELTPDTQLNSMSINHINELKSLREYSDDEALLEELLSDVALFSPETALEIHLPAGMDGIYLALNGKQVSQLAGQLSYVDIRSIPLLGSSRWMDGHLLDDRGRNLSTARFIQNKANNHDNSTLAPRYRDIWGQGQPGKLFTVAYDTARIAALLGSRLGLHGNDSIHTLHDPEGFPGESGHVYFDEYGAANKEFHIWRIYKHKLVPAS